MRLGTVVTALVSTFAIGCAPHTERAVRQTERISELSQSSGARFERIAETARTAAPDVAAIEQEAIAGRTEQLEIQRAAAAARRQIAHTQDIRSPWIGVLMAWGSVFLAAFVVIALTYLGIAPFLRRAVLRFTRNAKM